MVCPKIKECSMGRISKRYFETYCMNIFSDCWLMKEKKTPLEWLEEMIEELKQQEQKRGENGK